MATSWKNALSQQALLDVLGLQARRSRLAASMAAVGLIALGALTGGAVALLLTPRSGRALRSDIRARAGELGLRLQRQLTELPSVRVRGRTQK